MLLEVAQALLGVAVGLGLRRIGIDDQVELAGEVVDDGELLALQQQDVRATQRIGRAGLFELLLDVAHRVVAEVAGQSAAKARQAGAQRHLEALLVVGDEVQRRLAGAGFGMAHGLDDHAVAHDFGHGLRAEATRPHQRARGQADEAVAAKTLATHHRFEQEAVPAAVFRMRQLEVQRQRGFEVSERLDHQGNAVIALTGQAFEFEFGDHVEPPRSAPRAGCICFIHRRSRGRGRAPGAGGPRRSESHVCWLAPGPGSPALKTCGTLRMDRAWDEHDGRSVANRAAVS